MGKFYDLVRVNTATVGTGVITLGAAVSGFLTFVGAGVPDGEIVTYAIADTAASEIGFGVVGGSGTTLTRSVLKSTNSNAPIDLSGSAVVFITLAAEDLAQTYVRPTNVSMVKHGNMARMVCSPGEFIVRDQPLAWWGHGDAKIDGGLALGGPVNLKYNSAVMCGSSTLGATSVTLSADVNRTVDMVGTVFLPLSTVQRTIYVRTDGRGGKPVAPVASTIGTTGVRGSAGNGGGGTAANNGGAGSGILLFWNTDTESALPEVDLTSGTGSLVVGINGFVRMAVGGPGGKSTTSSGGAGGGGACAVSAEIVVKPGDTIFWSIAAGSSGLVSWINLNTNAAPTVNTTGVKADFGKAGVTTTPGGPGLTANCIGVTLWAGTAGATLTGGTGAGVAGNSFDYNNINIKSEDGTFVGESVNTGSNVLIMGAGISTAILMYFPGTGWVCVSKTTG